MAIQKMKRGILSVVFILLLMTAGIIMSSTTSNGLSGLEASGKICSSGGAMLRQGASTKSNKIAVLKNGAIVEVQKEVFTTKKKTGAKYRWYYVNTGAGYGYVRSDLVRIKSYGSALGKANKKIAYRKGAGTKMSKKGNIKKKANFTIVLEAKAKGSSAVWYKIKKGSKYYYVKKTNTTISNVRSGLPVAASSAAIVQSSEALAVVNGAVNWGIKIAADNKFHYGKKPNSQHNGCYFCGTQTLSGGRAKTGVVNYEYSYCCNPFVHACFAHGGNEKTMLRVCKNGSSYDFKLGRGYDISPLFAKLGIPDMSLLKKGDVICWDNHVVLYIGNGKIVESTGGDDNVPFSEKWNNSIRVCALTASKYSSAHGVYRYIGNGN